MNDRLLKIKGKILENVMPVGTSVDTHTNFTFSTCIASVIESQLKKKSSISFEEKCKLRSAIKRENLAVSGIGFAYVFDKDFINKQDNNSNFLYDKAADNYIDFSMRYLGYQYKIIENNRQNEAEILYAVKESINNNLPVLAETLVGSTWSVITGYDENNGLIGWFPDSLWIPNEIMIGNCPPDKTLNNGMFYKSDWYRKLSKIVVITGKSDEKLSEREMFSHWISVIEKPAKDSFVFGINAYDEVINLLLNFDEKIDDETICKIYSYVHSCGSLAEARAFVSSATKRKPLSMIPQTVYSTIRDSFNSTHAKTWELWAVMGNNNSDNPEDFSKINRKASFSAGNHIAKPKEYAYKIKSPIVREKIIQYYNCFKQNDLNVLYALKEALGNI